MPDSLATLTRTDDQPHEVRCEVELERVRSQLRDRHWMMLWGTIVIVVLAMAMQVKGETQVAFRGLSKFPLPELCGSRWIFDIACPGCGLTRSILSLVKGDWDQSLAFHRLGWIIALTIVLQIPYRLYRLHELKSRVPDTRWPIWFGVSLFALLIINWLYDGFVG